jgi:hypothetical protein
MSGYELYGPFLGRVIVLGPYSLGFRLFIYSDKQGSEHAMKNKPCIIVCLLIFITLNVWAGGNNERVEIQDAVVYENNTLTITIARSFMKTPRNGILKGIASADFFDIHRQIIATYYLYIDEIERRKWSYNYDKRVIRLMFFNVVELPYEIILRGAPYMIFIELDIESLDNLGIKKISTGTIW